MIAGEHPRKTLRPPPPRPWQAKPYLYVITSIFLIVVISCRFMVLVVDYSNVARYSVAVITGIFDAVKSLPFRIGIEK